MNYENLNNIMSGVSWGSDDLDMKVWAIFEGHSSDGDVPHYAREWFHDARNEGIDQFSNGACRATTDVAHALLFADALVPGHELTIDKKKHNTTVEMRVELCGRTFSQSVNYGNSNLALSICHAAGSLALDVSKSLDLKVDIASYVQDLDSDSDSPDI